MAAVAVLIDRFALHTNPYAMPFETDLPIWICRRPKVTLEQIWPHVKSFG